VAAKAGIRHDGPDIAIERYLLSKSRNYGYNEKRWDTDHFKVP
jgi:hypothetical protein